MPTSVRLDPETESLLKRLATSSGRSKSEVIRDALHRLFYETQRPDKDDSLYHSIADLIGVADGGPDDLGRQHKKHYREILERRRRR